MKITLVVLLLLTCFSALWPQEQEKEKMEITLEKALQMARENNKTYLASKEEVNRYKYKVQQNLGFLPTVRIDGTKNLSEKIMEIEMPSFYPGEPPQRIKLDFTKEYEFSLQIVQPVFTGGKIWLNFKNAQLDLGIAKEKFKNAQKELSLQVKKVFFSILVLREVMNANREALEIAETNLRSVEENLKLGMASQYDKLRAELAVSTLKPDILRIQKQLDLSILNLKFMTGIPMNTTLEIKGNLTYTQHQLEEARLLQESLNHASELTQMKMQMKKVNNLLKMAYAQFVPNISIVGSYSYRTDIFRLSNLKKNWESFYTINLAFSFPIFTGMKRTGEIGELRVMKKIMNLDFQQLNEAVTLQVNDLCMTARQEYDNIQAGLKNIETAKEGVRIAQLNYDEGLISILELNSSISQQTWAKVQFLQALYNYNIAVAELEKISDLLIDGSNQ